MVPQVKALTFDVNATDFNVIDSSPANEPSNTPTDKYFFE